MQAATSRAETIIIYGSYGYTGRLIVKECQSKKLKAILAGRNETHLQRQSLDTGYAYRVVTTDDTVALQDLLAQGAVVVHCAGPFQFTSKQMVEACLATGTHYTDITGEYQVFEMLAEYDDKAKKRCIMILPGAGFDVVPSDCLSRYLKNKLPDATRLELAFHMSKGGLSRGTSKTMIEGLGDGSMIRENGKLQSVGLGDKVIDVDFGSFTTTAMNIPWGDISTAWHSTNIPNIAVFIGANEKLIRRARLSRYFNWLFRQRWLKNYLLKKIDQRPDGPAEERRISGKSFLWGRVTNASGNSITATLETMNGYSLTASTSTLIASKIIQGNFKPGFQTPAMAYGADLILEVAGTVRKDVDSAPN
jgi:short subunit dehydrogenase-like uncharacterized protein